MSTVQESPVYRFGDLTLDVANRELMREEERLDLSSRYFDALVLLVREQGQLVEKDRFFEIVWSDVVVSDSALTQCIKEIRRQLGDDASNPRFIETVPRHGYRFIAEVSVVPRNGRAESVQAGPDRPETTRASGANTHSPAESGAVDAVAGDVDTTSALSQALTTALASTAGGAVAGLLGGLLYGFGLAASPVDQALGTASVLLVMIGLSGFAGTVGGFGVGIGMAATDVAVGRPSSWRILGAVLGGMFVGGVVKLLGVDAFNLLFGRTPAGITGGVEGALLGLAVGLGARLGGGVEARVWWRPVAAAAATGAAIGVLIALTGGNLMGGSLDRLAQSFSETRLQLDALARYFGEVHFGRTSQVVLAGLEALIFATCVVGALVTSRRLSTHSSARQ